jgi:hypothetical protein
MDTMLYQLINAEQTKIVQCIQKLESDLTELNEVLHTAS